MTPRAGTFLLLAALASCHEEEIAQPIPFNHRIHVVKNELGCDTCHETVFKAARAGLPMVETCLGCHGDDIVKNPAAKPHIETVRAHGKAGTEVPWVRLYRLPQHVYYSHRRHAGIAKLACSTCHGDVGERETPPPRPIGRTLLMDTCMDCHERHGIDHECAWCHR